MRAMVLLVRSRGRRPLFLRRTIPSVADCRARAWALGVFTWDHEILVYGCGEAESR